MAEVKTDQHANNGRGSFPFLGIVEGRVPLQTTSQI